MFNDSDVPLQIETTNFNYDPDSNYDEATIKQQREIENEIISSQALIDRKENLDSLENEFSSDLVYFNKIKSLKKRYSCLRRTRGDGNCFYRAFGFAYFERLLTDKKERERFRPIIEKSKDELVSLGFPECTIEDFHSTFLETFEKVENNCTEEDLVQIFNDQSYSDYMVVFLRLLVSGHLQREMDFYSCFIEGNLTVKEFCSQEVEPMGKESDQIHIIALTAYTKVGVRIEYLDRSGSEQTVNHNFPEGVNPLFTLLYRPGHYDILY